MAVPLGLVGKVSLGWLCVVGIGGEGIQWVALWGGRRMGGTVCRGATGHVV